jgi:alpha-D-xyloside xylohydrolase
VYHLDNDEGPRLFWRAGDRVLLVEPWGPDSVRVRAAIEKLDDTLPGALDRTLIEGGTWREAARAESRPDGSVFLANGRIRVEGDQHGRLRFLRTGTERELLSEIVPNTWCPGPREFAPLDAGGYRLEQYFTAYDDERVFGLGQHLHGRFDQKGLVIDLVQRNTEVTIPFACSSRGYGLLWNNPALGRVELAADATRWVAESARQIDYWITAGDTPAQIMQAYAEATGHPPLPPAWASGFWQSKLRYRTQQELLEVAREYSRRGLPLSAIVCDFFHWTRMGDWSFDPGDWPDPAGMVEELAKLETPDGRGVKLAVSVWPTLEEGAENFDAWSDQGFLVGDSGGGPLTHPWPVREHGEDHQLNAYHDATNPAARAALWERLRANYLALGVAAFWLDACEPDIQPDQIRRARYHAGSGSEVGNIYATYHARTIAEGLAAAGGPDHDRPLSLIRSAWAGSQRYGAALWSGDIAPTFASLTAQVRAGLNVAMSGIPYWNTDIGGFQGGDPDDPAYREVMIRWFQYGTFSPIMRLHGDREPNQPFTAGMTGGPNEIWSFGDQAYEIMRAHLLLRERLRPYLATLADAAHQTGAPLMRPLFFDIPEDAKTWSVDDQFLLGPDILVAPVTEAGARSRAVYLPDGADWREAFTGTMQPGGKTVEAAAPLDHLPVFTRAGADIATIFDGMTPVR